MISVFLSLAVVLLALFAFAKYRHSYWKNMGVPYVQPHPFFGNIKAMFQEHSSQSIRRLYDEMKGKGIIGGMYFFFTPIAIVLKPDIIKDILVKDFHNFNHRGIYHNVKDDPISGHMFALKGEPWKNLRTKVSPTFTSGKLKMMFETILKVSEEFRSYVDEYAVTGATLEMKDVLARFTTDVIGTCAFGIDCNTIRTPDSEFRRIGQRFFENKPLELVKLFFVSILPELSIKLGLKITAKEVEEFFLRITRETVDYREKNKVERNDFMNLLIQLKNDGKLKGEHEELGKITMEELAAQCFVFFLAGFETSSATMTFCLLELAENPGIQEKLRGEIEKVLAQHDDKVTYEACMNMTYLDQVINETLRKYPSVDTLMRVAENDYKVPNTDITFRKGMQVFIPIYAMQHDPEHYPNPEDFDPERFNSENMRQRNPYTFLPFGEGPRNCIGMRFGMMQTRLGLIAMIRHFKFSQSEKTVVPIVFKTGSPVLSPKDGVWLKVEKVN